MEKNSLYFLIIVGTIILITSLVKDKIDYFDSRLNSSLKIIQDLNSKINNKTTNLTNSDSLICLINTNNLEQESYMDMLDRESDWYIAYVSILFAIFAIVGVSIFRYELMMIQKQTTKEIEDYHKKYGIHNNEFNDLKIKLYKTISNAQASTAKQYLTSSPAISFMSSLNAAKFINLAYDLNIYENKKEEKFTISNLKSAFSVLNKILQQEDIIRFRQHIKKYEEDIEQDFTDLFNGKRNEVKSKCAEVRVAYDLLMTIDLPVGLV
ncbi:MAG: hypothetical protein JNK69_12195 [Saprospiraceae bacterium]|nr:hypothetical protein [Saprospiraceae bacterium]